MLTHAELVALHRTTRREQVLSVYLDGSAHDPAEQRAWRVALEHGLKAVRAGLASASHEERERFDGCAETLDGLLAPMGHAVGAPGWVAFITGHGVQGAHALPVPVVTQVTWTTGACLAPYVRELKEERPVVVAMVDAHRADLYKYRAGAVEHIGHVRAQHVVDAASHMGSAARQGSRGGTRGAGAGDAQQRAALEGSDRMLRDTAEQVLAAAGSRGWILVGGTRRVVARLAADLGAVTGGRLLELDAVDIHATPAMITEAARHGASTLRMAADMARLATIADLAGARGLGVVGIEETRQALGATCVRDLYVTTAYRLGHVDEVEDIVRLALDQDAIVEEVSGHAAELLEALGGMAAGLRFRPATVLTTA
jgi:hypothetical protein